LIRKILGTNVAGQDEQLIFNSKLNHPLVAVGAPVEAYFPELAKRLQAELFVPRHADVANAVGTVSGKAVERITVLVKPGEGGGFIVHTPQERVTFMVFEEAIDFACKEGRRLVNEQAAQSGAVDIETLLERQDRYSALAANSDKDNPDQRIFIESIIEVSAVGRPWSD
jgi:N-methylhydantoinase A/oxoprolinase/acetone carboxylase beta subunit